MAHSIESTIVGMLGVVLMTGTLLLHARAASDAPMPVDVPATPSEVSTNPEKTPGATGSEIGAAVPLARRDVTPEGMTQGPSVTGPLVRIKGLKPKRSEPPPPTRSMTLRPVIVVDAGTLRHKSTTILLAGVDALTLEARCAFATREDWPCGRHARTALRRLIRGRAVVCVRDNGSAQDGSTVIARCSVAKRDITNWLIEQGWATPTNATDENGEQLFASAREAGRGQWRTRPQPVKPVSALPDVLSPDFGRVDLDLPDIREPAFDAPLADPPPLSPNWEPPQ